MIYCFRSDGSNELCHVYYAPLNFRDIMLASGKLPPDALPGDLAGQVSQNYMIKVVNSNKIHVIRQL